MNQWGFLKVKIKIECYDYVLIAVDVATSFEVLIIFSMKLELVAKIVFSCVCYRSQTLRGCFMIPAAYKKTYVCETPDDSTAAVGQQILYKSSLRVA